MTAIAEREGPRPAIRVMALPAFINRRTNPYNFLLYSALKRRGARVDEVTTASVLRAEHDVVHLHWPEYYFTAPWLGKALAKTLVMIVAMTRLRRRHIRIIWTVHNITGHEPLHPRWEARMWRWFVARVDGYIALSASSRDAALNRFPELADRPGFVIPHGHYSGEYPDDLDRAAARARLGLPAAAEVIAFVGTIRPYKNVPTLVQAFHHVANPGWRLLIAGLPADADLAAQLRAKATNDRRIRLDLGFVPRADVQLYLRAADLVVLPYAEVLNSGSALLALSFERPVLVPDRGSMPELQATAGAAWVRTYSGDLTPETLRAAMAWARTTPRDPSALLGHLDWDEIARQTLLAYETVRRQPASIPSRTRAFVRRQSANSRIGLKLLRRS